MTQLQQLPGSVQEARSVGSVILSARWSFGPPIFTLRGCDGWSVERPTAVAEAERRRRPDGSTVQKTSRQIDMRNAVCRHACVHAAAARQRMKPFASNGRKTIDVSLVVRGLRPSAYHWMCLFAVV